MANMSYCRFQNTYQDLRDCVNIVDEAIGDGKTMKQFLEDLSEEERYAFNRLRTYCQDFIYNVEELESIEEDRDPMDDFNYVGSPMHY